MVSWSNHEIASHENHRARRAPTLRQAQDEARLKHRASHNPRGEPVERLMVSLSNHEIAGRDQRRARRVPILRQAQDKARLTHRASHNPQVSLSNHEIASHENHRARRVPILRQAQGEAPEIAARTSPRGLHNSLTIRAYIFQQGDDDRGCTGVVRKRTPAAKAFRGFVLGAIQPLSARRVRPRASSEP